jgi:hypothetical protein
MDKGATKTIGVGFAALGFTRSALLCYELALYRTMLILYGIYQILFGSVDPNANTLVLILKISTNIEYDTSAVQQTFTW